MRRVIFKESVKEGYIETEGYFHCWSQYQDGDEAGPLAVVEKMSGQVVTPPAEWVKFIDPPEGKE